MKKRLVLVGYDTECNEKLVQELRKVLPDWLIQNENEVQQYLENKVEKYSPFGLNLLYNVEDELFQQVVLFQYTDELETKNKTIKITEDEHTHFWGILKDILLEQNTKTEVFIWSNQNSPRLKELAKILSKELTKQTPVCVFLPKTLSLKFNYPVFKLMNP